MSQTSSPKTPKPTSAPQLFFIFAVLGYPMVGVAVIGRVGLVWGTGIQTVVGLAVFAGLFFVLWFLYSVLAKADAQQRAYRRETYRGIYRVKGQPASPWTWLKENIKPGDYAWEIEPWRKDKLIYVQGLEEQWGVVWKAGFRPEDLEYVGPKPVSQYDWRDFNYDGLKPAGSYSWGRAKAKVACPFPVKLTGGKIHRWQYPI